MNEAAPPKTRRESIREYIQSWVNSPANPHFAVLIEGSWGCGKTHFVNSILLDDKFTKRKMLYISMFGISSSVDFERRLFYAAASKSRKVIYNGLGLATSVFSGSINVASGGWLNGQLDAAKSVERVTSALQKASNDINESFVVIDDLERCSFDKGTLLGILNGYIEHGGARVLLIANTEAIEETSFAAFKDKVVGQSFELPPAPAEAISAFIEELEASQAKEILAANTDVIHKLYELSNMHNLRAVRRCLWLIRNVISSMEQVHVKNAQLVESVIRQAFIFYMEYKLNQDASMGVLKPNDLIEDAAHGDKAARKLYRIPKDEAEQEDPHAKIIRKYGIGYSLGGAITLSQWAEIIQSGTINAELLNVELSESNEASTSDTWPAWRRLWHIHSWDFSLNSEEAYNSDLLDLQKSVNECEHDDPLEFMHVAGIVLHFSKKGLLKGSPKAWLDALKRCVDEAIAPNLSLARHAAAHWSYDSGYGGLGYYERDSEEFQDLLRYMKTRADEWLDHWRHHGLPRALLAKMKESPYDFIGEFVSLNGRGSRSYVSEPVLSSLPHAEFLEILLTLPREDERIFIDFFKQRYEDTPKLLIDEGPWWREVQERLNSHAQSENFPPRAMQVRGMAGAIDTLFSPRSDQA